MNRAHNNNNNNNKQMNQSINGAHDTIEKNSFQELINDGLKLSTEAKSKTSGLFQNNSEEVGKILKIFSRMRDSLEENQDEMEKLRTSNKELLSQFNKTNDEQRASNEKAKDELKDMIEKVNTLQEENEKLRTNTDHKEGEENKELLALKQEVELHRKYFADNTEGEYDCVIEGDNIYQMYKEGWRIIEKKDPTIESFIISAVGGFNKGKSFMLHFLSGKPIPHGFSTHTSGLSAIYAEVANEPLTFLDSKGVETPLHLAKIIKQQNNEEAKGPTQMLKDDKADSNPFWLEEEAAVKEYKICEQLIQRFILEKADFILALVGDVTFSDQIMLQRIKRDYLQRKQEQRFKRILVIHNLAQITDKSKIQEKIEKNILNIFDLKATVIPMTDNSTMNDTFYQDVSHEGILHFVIAKEGSEAGKYYNSTLKTFMENSIKTTTARTKFNPVIDLQKFLEEKLPGYVTFDGKAEILISIVKDEDKGKILKCNIKPRFKHLEFDAFDRVLTYDGEAQVGSELVTTATDVYFLIELPGMSKQTISTIKGKVLTAETGFFLEIKGKKVREKIDNINSVPFVNREFGTFSIKSPVLELKKYDILEPKKPERKEEDGLLIYKWALRRTHDEKDEEEGV